MRGETSLFSSTKIIRGKSAIHYPDIIRILHEQIAQNFIRTRQGLIIFHEIRVIVRLEKHKIRDDDSRLDNRFGKCIDSSLDELQSASKFNYCNPIVLLVHHRLAK